MAAEKTQYIIVPVEGLEAAENDLQQGQLFESLYQTFTSRSRFTPSRHKPVFYR
jgi:hypothetical protein